ncbi:MAG: hypothetical protein QXD94_06480 [Sulfolobales archaeon]
MYFVIIASVERKTITAIMIIVPVSDIIDPSSDVLGVKSVVLVLTSITSVSVMPSADTDPLTPALRV